MKNHNLWITATIVAVCSIAPSVTATVQAAPGAKEVFQPLYSQLDRATVNKDLAAVAAIYSPDYIGVKESGEKYNFDHVREGMLKLFAKYKTIRSKTVVQSAMVVRNGATIVTHYHGAYIRDSNVPGQEVTITVDAVARDYWVKLPNGWKLKQERHLSSHQARSASAV